MGEIRAIVLSGVAEHAGVTFTAGEPAGPIRVGFAGEWRVSGRQVPEAGVALFFDGERLYVNASVAGASLDGVALGSAWTQIFPPSELVIGAATIGFESDTPPRVSRPRLPSSPTLRDDRLRAVGLENSGGITVATGPTPHSVALRAPPEASSATRRVLRGLLVALTAAAASMVAFGVVGDLRSRHGHLVPHANTSPAASTPTPSPPAAVPTTAPSSTIAAVADAAPRAAPSPTNSPAPASFKRGARRGLTLEAQAVAAAQSGDAAAAAARYAELAAAHPENPAFAEAARILGRRARGAAAR